MRAFASGLSVPVPALSTSVALLATLLGPLMALAIAFEYWKSLALLLVVASVPALIRWPVAVAFGLYALVLPFDSLGFVADAGGATMSRLFGVLASGLLIGVGLVERRLIYPPITALCLGVFVFWGLLTLGWSVNLDLSQGRVTTLVSLLLLYVVAASFRVTAKELRAVIFLAILGGVIAAAVPAILGQDSVTRTRGVKIQQDEKANINNFAAGLIVPLLLALGQFFKRRQFALRVLAAGGMAIILFSVYNLASRGTVVAILVGVGWLIVRSRRFVPGLMFVAAGVAMVGFAPDVFFNRFNAVLDGTDSTGSGRLRIWMVGLEALKDHWALGSGLGTFQVAYNVYVPASPSKATPVAHNLYLSTAVELGVLGLVLLLLTLAVHFRASLFCRRPAIDLISIEAGCLAVMAAAAFGEYLYAKSFWLPWTLLVWSVHLHTEGQGSELSQPAPVRGGHHLSGAGRLMRHASRGDTSPVPSQ